VTEETENLRECGLRFVGSMDGKVRNKKRKGKSSVLGTYPTIYFTEKMDTDVSNEHLISIDPRLPYRTRSSTPHLGSPSSSHITVFEQNSIP
jgi:hypothetical protein